MNDLLTTKQLQDLLQVDRITIYRMLNDGRLRGFKVGGQWRFSREQIESWLQEQQAALGEHKLPAPADDRVTPSAQVLSLSCVQAIQGVCAEALGVAVITIDPEGQPLSEISHSCAFCDLILTTAVGRRRCGEAWRSPDHSRLQICHAGLLCFNAPVEVQGQIVAITAGCQFVAWDTNGDEAAWQATLPALAATLGLSGQALQAAAGSVRRVAVDHLPHISQLLQRVADTFSQIGQERLELLSRLQHIAQVSKI